jgi:hypothetical protein
MHFMFLDGTIGEVKECFLRINTLGMKVTTADSIITGAETLNLRDFTHEVRAQIADPGFKDIPEMPILFALAATQGGKEGTEARGRALLRQVHQLEEDSNRNERRRRKLAADWTKLASCFGKAVNYLSDHFSVLSRDYLGYDYIVSMLALFYFWNGRGPSEYQKREIRKWFWATCVGQRYSGGSSSDVCGRYEVLQGSGAAFSNGVPLQAAEGPRARQRNAIFGPDWPWVCRLLHATSASAGQPEGRRT